MGGSQATASSHTERLRTPAYAVRRPTRAKFSSLARRDGRYRSRIAICSPTGVATPGRPRLGRLWSVSSGDPLTARRRGPVPNHLVQRLDDPCAGVDAVAPCKWRAPYEVQPVVSTSVIAFGRMSSSAVVTSQLARFGWVPSSRATDS